MKPNKKYEKDGIQYAMYPNPIMNITQSINGALSHRGTNAIDDAQADGGRSNGYAPCDMVCVDTDYINGNAMFWQTKRPVKTVNYGITDFYMMVIHDNTANAYVGMEINQGQQLFTEGIAGNATGNHSHIEVGIGKYPGYQYIKSGYLTSSGYPVFMLPGNVNPADVFFVDDTQIINNGGLNWKNIGNSADSNKIELIEEKGVATLRVDEVQARLEGPTGKVVRSYNTGDRVPYTHKYIGHGHRYVIWTERKKKIFMAVSATEVKPAEGSDEQWATFSAPGEKPSENKTDDSMVKGHGIDISEANANVKYEGNDFVIARASYGEHTDKLFNKHISECQKLNIPVGVYHFAYGKNETEARAEINYFLETIKDADVKVGYWLDLEENTYWSSLGLNTPEHFTMLARIWDEIMTERGLYHGIYAGKHWFDNFIKVPVEHKWIADWGNDDAIRDRDLSAECVLHQYTSNGNTLDEVVSYVDLSSFESHPEETPDSDTVNALLDDIIERAKIAKQMLG